MLGTGTFGSTYLGGVPLAVPASISPTINVPVTFSVLTGVTFIPRVTSVTYYYVRSGG